MKVQTPSESRPIWRPYTQEQTALPPTWIERAQGAFLIDSQGRPIFDGISSWWLITHGHCHQKIVEAIQTQAAKLDQILFANFTHEAAEELAATLIQLTPTHLNRVFLSDNGSTAVEVALKMALQACAQRGQTKRQKFMAFEKSYHGDTVGAMSVSGFGPFTKPYRHTLFQVIRCPQPLSQQAQAQDFVRPFAELLAKHESELAGVILEPLVQGAGGMIMWPPEAITKIGQLCRAAGLYLIFDEVMTGFGRTGTMWAFEHFNVTPDILCLSKGLTGGTLPLAATLACEEIYASFLAPTRDKMFFHGHSFTGNPISCAAAVANLKIFADEDVLSKISDFTAIHQRGLEHVSRLVPISNPRVCGTIAAFEVGDASPSDYLNHHLSQITEQALKKGLFVRPLGRTLYLMPPFGSTIDDLNTAWSHLAEVLTEAEDIRRFSDTV